METRAAPRAAAGGVPVTGLRAWLACPFRFYLTHVLKMEPIDSMKSELDARDFGTSLPRRPGGDGAGDSAARHDRRATGGASFCWGIRFARRAAISAGEGHAPAGSCSSSRRGSGLAKAAAVQGARARGPAVGDRAGGNSRSRSTVGGLEVRGTNRSDRSQRAHRRAAGARLQDERQGGDAAPRARAAGAGGRRVGLPNGCACEVNGRVCVWRICTAANVSARAGVGRATGARWSVAISTAEGDRGDGGGALAGAHARTARVGAGVCRRAAAAAIRAGILAAGGNRGGA